MKEFGCSIDLNPSFCQHRFFSFYYTVKPGGINHPTVGGTVPEIEKRGF